MLLAANASAETLSVVAHIHTPVSGGEYTPDEIAGILASRGLDAGIITDHDHLEVHWGIPLFRNLIGYTYRLRSIATEGADRYASSISAAAARFPGLILIPGVEANPYYRIEIDWTGLRFRVHNLHEHIVAIGLTANDLARLPAIANGFQSSSARSGLAAAAVLGLAFGVLAILRRGALGKGHLRRTGAPRKKRFPLLIVILVIGSFAMIDTLSQSASRITQYGPDDGALPYQLFIDWVAKRGGLTFWSHPGVGEVIRKGPFEVVTRPYYEHIARTDRYTGLEDFGTAMAGTGGIWDQLLLEYGSGLRKNPPWFLAQADFKTGNPDQLLSVVNYVEVQERTERGLLDALRAGRFYATQVAVGREWRLETFLVSDGSASAGSGGLLETSSPVRLTARLIKLIPSAHALTVQVIRQGITLFSERLDGTRELSIDDSALSPGERRYYRLNAGRPERIELVTNPIFVQGKPARNDGSP